MANKKNEETVEEAAPVAETAEDAAQAPAAEGQVAADAAAAPAEKPKRTRKAATKTDEAAAAADTAGGSDTARKSGKRAERIGVVTSDKMTKTVVVRVDRLVKHPIYRKYVRRRKKFMAHDEHGAKMGDKVRIIETRPLSARKRWRVVEIIQKAEV